MELLKITNLTCRFGGVVAVDNLNVSVSRGEIVGLIGPNGAGKTTVFNAVSGFVTHQSGRIWFNGQDITRLRPFQRARQGLVRTFQAATLFPELTVLENIALGAHRHYPWRFFSTLIATPSYRSWVSEQRQIAETIVKDLGLESEAELPAGLLPTGTQRVLSLAVALAARPTLLLLDEPLAGLSGSETDRIVEIIRETRHRGITVWIVEHNMRAIMRLCDRIIVLHSGRHVATGTPDEVRANEEVNRIYLGSDAS